MGGSFKSDMFMFCLESLRKVNIQTRKWVQCMVVMKCLNLKEKVFSFELNYIMRYLSVSGLIITDLQKDSLDNLSIYII